METGTVNKRQYYGAEKVNNEVNFTQLKSFMNCTTMISTRVEFGNILPERFHIVIQLVCKIFDTEVIQTKLNFM